jgi:D-alanyl-D-alanine carboxypeptidase
VDFLRSLLFKSPLCSIALLAALACGAPRAANAEALLLVEADSGKVLQAENATYPWYPASLTKLMTAYVTLNAVHGVAGRGLAVAGENGFPPGHSAYGR